MLIRTTGRDSAFRVRDLSFLDYVVVTATIFELPKEERVTWADLSP